MGNKEVVEEAKSYCRTSSMITGFGQKHINNLIHVIEEQQKEIETVKNAYVNLDEKRDQQVSELQKEIERLKGNNATSEYIGQIPKKPRI